MHLVQFSLRLTGVATVIRHRQDDDQRSSHYDELLSAETRAVKNAKGVHSKKEAPTHRISEVSGMTLLSIRLFLNLPLRGPSFGVQFRGSTYTGCSCCPCYPGGILTIESAIPSVLEETLILV